MASSADLLTSLEEYQDLSLIVADGKGTVKVDKTALKHLLLDHTYMIMELQKYDVTVRTDPPKRRRETITEE